jgi:signal transduction histidine kinase/FixJ family two-component response regulator
MKEEQHRGQYAPPERKGEALNILIVDDKVANLYSLKALLEKENKPEAGEFNYILCSSAEEGLKVAIKEELALILLDVQMPEMDGYEMASILKGNKKTAHTPIIFITAIDQNSSNMLQGFKVGAVDFLFKPLNPTLLKAKVDVFIDLYKREKELELKNKMLQNSIQILSETQFLLKGVLDSAFIGIMAFRAIRLNNRIVDFEFMLINKAAQQIINRNDLFGKRLLEEMPGNKADGLFEKYVTVVETGKSINIEQYYEHESLKNWFHILANKWEDGFVVAFEDITHRKSAEDIIKTANVQLETAKEALVDLNNELESRVNERTLELRNAQDELVKTNEHLKSINTDLDNFIYTASHDLKAPISNIEGLVTLLKSRLSQEDNKAHQLLTLIEDSVARFKVTIKDLTQVARLQHQEFEDVNTIEFAGVVHELTLTMADDIARRNVRIAEDYQVPTVQFSAKNMRSILYNLLSNAIKYCPSDVEPYIHISTYPSGAYTVLSVKDNGYGIREADIPKVFKMFKRLHTHTEGTGIGMYIVKRILENSGGKIEVQSEYGKGSEFLVYVKG